MLKTAGKILSKFQFIKNFIFFKIISDGGFDARFKRGSMPNFKPLNEDNVKKAM